MSKLSFVTSFHLIFMVVVCALPGCSGENKQDIHFQNENLPAFEKTDDEMSEQFVPGERVLIHESPNYRPNPVQVDYVKLKNTELVESLTENELENRSCSIELPGEAWYSVDGDPSHWKDRVNLTRALVSVRWNVSEKDDFHDLGPDAKGDRDLESIQDIRVAWNTFLDNRQLSDNVGVDFLGTYQSEGIEFDIRAVVDRETRFVDVVILGFGDDSFIWVNITLPGVNIIPFDPVYVAKSIKPIKPVN